MYLIAYILRYMLLAMLCQASAVYAADLTGIVQDEDGMPLAGAIVAVGSLQKKAPAPHWPLYVYAENARYVRTNDTGVYTIPDVYSDFRYALIIAKPGYATSAKTCDPSAPRSAGISLLKQSNDIPQRMLAYHGRVLDTAGNPLADALISPVGYTCFGGDGRDKTDIWHCGGTPTGSTTVVSNEKGEFTLLISAETRSENVFAQIKARNLANCTATLPKTNAVTGIILNPGVTLQGRLVKDGRGQAHILVYLTAQSIYSIAVQPASTDATGAFTFYNVPAKGTFNLSTPLEKAPECGLIPRTQVTTGKPGETRVLPDIALMPAKEYTGRITLKDGAIMPPKLDAFVQSIACPVSPDGTFHFWALPGEAQSISIDFGKYRLDPCSRFNPVNESNWGFPAPIQYTTPGDSTKCDLVLNYVPWK